MELDVFRERGDGSEAAVRDREGAVPPGPTCRSRAGRRRTTPQDSGGTVLPRGERGWPCLMTGREKASGNEVQEADVAEFWRALSGAGGGGMQRTGNESTEAWGAVRSLSSRTQEAGGDRPDEPRGPRQAVL